MNAKTYICFRLLLLTTLLAFFSPATSNAAFLAKRTVDTVKEKAITDTPALQGNDAAAPRLGFLQKVRGEFGKKDHDTVVRPPRHKRSGIFGRLSFYFGLLSSIAFVVALCTLFSPALTTALVVWLYSAFFAVVLGIIGMFRRKKKGMAMAGIILGVTQFALLAAVMSFISAVVSALPGIMAGILIIGHM